MENFTVISLYSVYVGHVKDPNHYISWILVDLKVMVMGANFCHKCKATTF